MGFNAMFVIGVGQVGAGRTEMEGKDGEESLLLSSSAFSASS